MRLLVKGGRVVDPANNINGVYDILIEDTKIGKVAKNISSTSAKVIDAKGKIVMPGLVDMHVHLRQPGREDKETIATGILAALKGGVTSVLAMPNTTPAIDCAENVELVKRLIQRQALACVFIAGAITKGRRGQELTDIVKLKEKGAIAVTDDGASVDNADLFLMALKKAKESGLLVICHSEDKSISKGGVVNLGVTSTRMGLRGVSCESEYRRVQRDIELARKAGVKIHIAHISCKESVEIISKARRKGIPVSAETAPHYFALCEDKISGFDTNMKVNPPLRSRDDVKAINEGLKHGIIDVIASDHAPHTEAEKDVEFDYAPFGIIGLETAFSLAVGELVNAKVLTLSELVQKMSLNPAKILNLPRKGNLSPGSDADVVIVDVNAEWTLQEDEIKSRSKNSPFIGWKLKGVIEHTICAGKEVYPVRESHR